MEKMKDKGITLIALIITIIILIILAVVMIRMLYNTNFIGLATNGVDKYTEEQMREEALIDNVEQKMQEISNDNGEIILSESTKTLAIIDSESKEEQITATLSEMSGTITWTSSNEECVKVTPSQEAVILTPLSVGTATITARCYGKTAICNVTVIELTNTISLENSTEPYVNITVKVEGSENQSINIKKPDDKIETSSTVTYKVSENGTYKFLVTTEKDLTFDYFVNVNNILPKELVDENSSKDDFTLNSGSSGFLKIGIVNGYRFSFSRNDWDTPRSYGEWTSVKKIDFSKYNTCSFNFSLNGYSETGKNVVGWIKIGDVEIWRETRSFPGWNHSGDGLSNDYEVNVDLKKSNISGLQPIIVGRRFKTTAL